MGTPTTIELTPTFENIGVIVKYSGTTPTQALMEWKRSSEASWRPGPRIRYPDGTFRNLVCIDTTDLECRTSVIRVQEATQYDVRMTVDGQMIQGTCTTKSNIPPESTTGVLRYVSDDGNDANPGTETAPWRTLAKALGSMGAGNKLYIRGRHIIEAQLAKPPSGTASSWTHLAVWPGYEATTRIDFVRAAYALGTGTWRSEASYHPNMWSAPVQATAPRVGLRDYLLFPYQSISALASLGQGIPGGYYSDSRTYVILPDLSNPNGQQVNIPAVWDVNWVWSGVNYVRISGLKFGYGYEHIEATNCSNIWIDHNEFINVISAVRCFGTCGDWTMEYNHHFQSVDYLTWPWDKGLVGEGGLAYFDTTSGRRNVFRYNLIEGAWDGLMLTAWSSDANLASPLYENDMDVYGNRILNYIDDSMELEGACKNMRVYNNRCRGGFMGIAPSPVRRGPVFYFRNTMRDFTDAAVKTGLDSKNFWSFNNTYNSHLPEFDVQGWTTFAGGSIVGGFISINDIMSVNRNVFRAGWSPSKILADYNCYWTDGAFSSDFYSLAAAQREGWYGANSIQANPQLDANLRPYSGSPCEDTGVVIEGINDLDFTGVAPDRGGLESQGAPAPPVADFLFSPNVGSAPLPVQFTDRSSGQIKGWLWEFGDGSVSSEQNPLHVYTSQGTYYPKLTVTGPGGSHSYTSALPVTVSGVPQPCVLTIRVQGNGTTIPSSGTHNHMTGDVVTIQAVADAGWRFVRWEGDVPGADLTLQFTISGDTSVTAVFEQITYALTIGVQGQGNTTPSPGSYPYYIGQVVNITARASTGWRFQQWIGPVDNPESSTATVTMDSDKSIVAVFVEDTYTLSMAIQGEGVVDPPVGTHVYQNGTVVPITATPAEGWSFTQWVGSVASLTSPSTTTIVDGDKTVTAVFTQITKTLSIAATEGGLTTPELGEHLYPVNQGVTVTALPSGGYYFVEWHVDGTIDARNPLSLVMDRDINILAVFAPVSIPPNHYSITVTAELGGTTLPEPGIHLVEAGSSFPIEARPSTGYRFDHWEGDIYSTLNPIVVTPTANISIIAVFAEVVQPPPADWMTTAAGLILITLVLSFGTKAFKEG